MAKANQKPPSNDEWLPILTEVENESDRGVVLLLVAWVDDALLHILKDHFVDDADQNNALFFSGNAPLGTFSSRIKLAHALGFIGDVLRDDFDTMRGIRNDFAHSRGAINFETPSIRDRIANLTLIEMINTAPSILQLGEGPRNRFMVCASFAIGYLLLIGNQVESKARSTGVGLEMYVEKACEKMTLQQAGKWLDQMETNLGLAGEGQPTDS